MTEAEMKEKLMDIPEAWRFLLNDFLSTDDWRALVDKVTEEYCTSQVFPPIDEVYRALTLIDPDDVKCVIIGQDPYFNPGQADGLAFSVSADTKLPPSLINIYKELYYEFGYPIPKRNGDLSSWARQGVLLLNATLTVRSGEANSHASLGWTTFTDEIIRSLDRSGRPIVYLLWGNYAKKKESLIKDERACIIKTAHPSPLSANHGFFCSDCFRKCNRYLRENHLEPINFQIRD